MNSKLINFMANNQNKKLINFINYINSLTNDQQLITFINTLYKNASIELFNELTEQHLFECGQSLYKLLASKSKNKAYQITHFIDPKDDKFIVIQITNPNVAFVLDSICNEFRSKQIDICFINYSDFHNDDVIQIHVLNNLNSESIFEILSNLERVLECVNLSVADWSEMQNMMLKNIKLLDNVKIDDIANLKDESTLFLKWLVDKHFIFLGTLYLTLNGNKTAIYPNSKLGLAKTDYFNFDKLKYLQELESSELIVIRQWEEKSLVHRSTHMDVVICKHFDNNNICIGANIFFGLFTSSVYFQSVRQIPLLREKIKQVIQMYQYPEDSYNCKELVTALEAFPRGDLLKTNVDELYAIATDVVSLSLVPKIKVFMRMDNATKFISCIIFIPEKKFSTEIRTSIEQIICNELNGVISKKYVQIGESPLARLQLIIKLNHSVKITDDWCELIEQKITQIISNWHDEFNAELNSRYPQKGDALKLYNKYGNAFDSKYRTEYSPKIAVDDVELIEKMLSKGSVLFDINLSENSSESQIHLKMFSLDIVEPTLSSTLPSIEHLGLKAIDLETSKVAIAEYEDKAVYIRHFRLQPANDEIKINTACCNFITDALYKVWDKTLDDDCYNSLITTCSIDYRKANLIRAYCKYLKQTRYPLSMDYTIQVLLENVELTKKLIKLFESKFDIINLPTSMQKFVELELQIRDDLNAIKSINADKVFRSLLSVILATLRTNFYQTENSEYKSYLSFKLKSSEVSDLPLPRPYAEIFVYSARFEGIHLRGGKIARGGLRWSDRPEDFRTEILGLMKAQMTKNSVIVPVGSKGGFIIKDVQLSDGKDKYLAEGINCYKLFLSGLLDITDNIVDGNVVSPDNMVKYDDDDPYLVVAADKGTAAFSDYANQISNKYMFWLGDAFASGGSAGYDHKKMGITAKGAWISVVRHFEDMGINIISDEFTCTGIGDMSGDVFGNGMILSNNIKLIAAFNHIHIFLDPNPDSKKSFLERERLFNLPGSQWTDYNAQLISAGGGIFNRNLKQINLSPEIKNVLRISSDSLSPDELIKAILMAEVDLLWNGGIGTYVKSKTENNERIGDKANDNLRVNGNQLNAKIVGEGGNLGFTQLGRIEYALKGGKINTDFIDNSAGVDCSDHEVNIKIALAKALKDQSLSIDQRNILLEKMTNDIALLVLNDNYKQTQLLTFELNSVHSKINSHAWLLKYLDSEGELDRNVEFLPNDEDLQKTINDKQNLTRPELAVLVAYAKNSALKLFTNNILPQSEYLEKYLFSYFPDELSQNFPDLIRNHSLKNQILATVLVNDFINTLGCTFFHQLLNESGSSATDIIAAYVIVTEIFNIHSCWSKVEALGSSIPLKLKVRLFNHIQAMLSRNIIWLLNISENIQDVDNIINFYKPEVKDLSNKIDSLLSIKVKNELDDQDNDFNDYPESEEVLASIKKMRSMKISLDIIYLAKTYNYNIEDCGRVYYKVAENLYIRWLISKVRDFVPKQYLQTQALRTLINELHYIQMKIVKKELKNHSDGLSTLHIINRYPNNFKRLQKYVDELMAGDTSDVFISKLTIAIKYLKDLMI